MEVGQVTTTANSSRSITSMDTSTSSATCTTTNAISNGSPPLGISLASLLASSTVGPSSNCNTSSSSGKEGEKPPKWQLDLLMEKLRQKSVQLKPLVDTSKNIRQALMERRCIIDQNDKGNLQKSLDSLQQSLRVNSLQSMVERLEMVARQLGLRFTPGGTGHEWFIHSDMFYLELLIDSNGMVEDVKIQHEGKTEQQSCPEIVESLKKTNFQDFTAHLEGLVSIYQLTADKKIKSKAYIALQCLEADLASISTTYSHINEADTVIMKCLLGLLQPRKGGHPVKLVYFISPYEFLDVTTKSMLSNDVNTVINNKLGSSATIHIQASSSHKLQMSTTVNLTRTPDGKTIPRYGVLNATNSTVLPACFVLNFGKPIPICVDLLKAIHATTEIESFDLTDTQPILNLVTHQLSDGALNCSEQGLFVALPDQVHCYFMTDTTCLEGVMVSSICFTLASQLPQVVAILRQQSAFNTLVGSCVRVGSKPELDHIVFEVSALSHQKLSVSFQHPLDDSLVTLEFDLRDVTHPHCHLHAVANATDIIPTLEEHACKVVKRSMSIPITLRAVIRRWQSMKAKADPPNPDFSVAVGGNGLGNLDVTRINDRSCGAESADRKSNASHQNVMVPPGIMNFNSVATGNITNKPPPPPLSTSSSYSISPVGNYASQSPQSPMDILSYMNPYLNQMNLAAGGPPFPNITQNMAIQMIASQMGQNPATPSQMLMGLLDQVGQTQKRRKRKNTTDNLPSPKVSPQSIRPNQSPSRPPHKSPMRRQSDSSDGSGAAVDKSSAINMLMTELGMDQLPDSRWNIDITPVNTSSESIDDLDSFKKQMAIKKTTPKRSLSLDSHSSEDISSIQSLIEGQDFKPLVTPSLSITPVSTTSSSATASLLASIRPGIEIIPLPHNNPVSIPTSLTVTPIMSSAKSNNNSNSNNNEKQDKPKKPKDRSLPGKRKFDPSGGGGGDGDGRPTKLPFLDNRGRISPNINFTKKPTSPNLLLNSPSKPSVPTSQGKPSVSTLKSVSSSSTPNSPKFGENIAVKQKIKKPNTKGLKSFMGMGNIPQLKALSPAAVAVPSSPVKQQVTGGDSNNQLIGGMEASRMTTTDIKLMNQANQAAVTALQQAAATLVANAAQKPHAATNIAKKGGLAAVIDKLKSVHSSTELPNIGGPPSSSASSSLDKKESASAAAATTMSAKDYLKVSTAITNDVMQQKKALTANSTVPGQEYMVKGGQGLKLTINKAKLKDPTKSPKPGGLGLKSPLSGVIKKGIPGMKPLSHLSALSAKLAIVTKKSTPINKDLMKDLSLKPGNTPSSKVKDGKQPRLESEDLTKKLFLPGSVKSLESGTFASAPIFDPNKFQIPKKSRGASNAYENNSNSNKASSSSSSIEKDVSSSSALSSKSGKSTPPPSLTSNFMDFSLVKEKASTSSTMPVTSFISSSMEADTSAPPELVSEICSTATGSDGSWRSEPPALIEVSGIATSVPLFMEKSKSEDSAMMFTPPQAPPAVEQPKGLLTSTSPPLGHGMSRNNSSGTSEVSSMDFTSPESPDPVNLVVNSSSAPQTIPTNPVSSPGAPLNEEGPNAVQASSGMSVTPPPETATQQQPPVRIPTPPQIMNLQTQPPPQIPPEDVDEDRLIIDDGHANGNYTSSVPILKEVDTFPSSATSASSETVEKCAEEKSKSPEMPPPPAPVDLSNSSSNSSFASPQAVVFAPPASPKGVPSPLGVGGGGATMSIASVHIVHSPQPNSPSPALLRSPMVQMSASPAASPYQIDDDLMDEALIGGSSK